MDLPAVVSRDEWLAARTELLAEEKALTRARDSAFERGLDHLLSPYNYLELTPMGRQDGIDDFTLHDTYTPADLAGTATAH